MTNQEKKYDYGKCHACGKRIQEQQISQAFWVSSSRVSKSPKKLVVVESVPVGVCPRCGKKIVRADVGRKLMILISNRYRSQKRRTIAVPIVKYGN